MGEAVAPFTLLLYLIHFLVEETEVQGQGAPCISHPCQCLCPHLCQGNLQGSDPAWVISPPSAMYDILPGFQLQIPQLGTNHSFLEEQVPRPQTRHNRCFLNTRTIGREKLSRRLNSSSRPVENVSSQSSLLMLFQPVLEDGLE